MRAVETNVPVRLVSGDDAVQVAAEEEYVAVVAAALDDLPRAPEGAVL